MRKPIREGAAVIFIRDNNDNSPLLVFTMAYDDGNYFLSSGNITDAVEKYREALKTWKRALKNNDKSIPEMMVAMCLTNLGSAYVKLEMLDKALSTFERALSVHPSFLLAKYNRAWLLENMQRNSEAIQAWESYLADAKQDLREQESIAEAKRHLNILKTKGILKESSVPFTTTSELRKNRL